MAAVNDTEPVAASERRVRSVLRTWMLDTLQPDIADPPVPQDDLWDVEFVAFHQAFKLAVDAVFEMDNTVGVAPTDIDQAFAGYSPHNSDWLAATFHKIVLVVEADGDQVVFQPDAAAVDYACAFLVIAAWSVAVTAKASGQSAGQVARHVLDRWETSPVADVLPGPAVMLATNRGPDDPDPAGTGSTYGETSMAASVDQVFHDPDEAAGFVAALTMLDGALPLVFAGIDNGVPVLGVDASSRPDLVAAAATMSQSQQFAYRFDAICEPGLPAVAATFVFADLSIRFTVLVPHNDPMWVEFNRFAANRGHWMMLFRSDGGASRPTSPLTEPGSVVVMFEPGDLGLALERVDLSVR